MHSGVWQLLQVRVVRSIPPAGHRQIPEIKLKPFKHVVQLIVDMQLVQAVAQDWHWEVELRKVALVHVWHLAASAHVTQPSTAFWQVAE